MSSQGKTNQNHPTKGKGKIINNRGYIVVQVTELKNHQEESVGCSQEELLPLAGNVVKRKEHKPHLGIPTSYGAGTHISLNQKQRVSVGDEVEFTIQGFEEYQDGGSYWVVMVVSLEPKGHYQPTMWPGHHISIGQRRFY